MKHVSVPDRDMLAIGIDIDGGDRALAARRAKRGECETCGTPTHKISVFGKKTALSKEGKVYKGRCLRCHPLDGSNRKPSTLPQLSSHSSGRPSAAHPSFGGNYPPPSQPAVRQMQMQRSPQQPRSRPSRQIPPELSLPQQVPEQHVPQHQECKQQPSQLLQEQPLQPLQPSQPQQSLVVPRSLDLEDDGDISVVSGITMDLRLIQGARDWDPSNGYDSEEEDAHMPATRRRPEPSVGGDDPYADARPDPEHMPTRTMHSSSSARNRERKPPPSHPGRNSLSADFNGRFLQNVRHPGYDDYPERAQLLPFVPRGDKSSNPPVMPARMPSVMDSDGYPGAVTNGGNVPNNILPPGGMDSLFQNRSARAMNSHSEIQLPGKSQDAPYSFAEVEEMEDHIPPPIAMKSVESGPMLIDDFPEYNDGVDEYQSSRVPYSHDAPSLNNFKLQANENSQRSSRSYSTDHYSQNKSQHQSIVSARERAAPPLRTPDLRGLPDDDMIMDPMNPISGGAALRTADRGRADVDVIQDPMSSMTLGGAGHEMARDPHSTQSAAAAPSKDRVSNMMRMLSRVERMNEQPRKSSKKKDKSMQEIPVIIECINSNDADSALREKAFNALAQILWRSGEKARDYIIEHKGIDALVTAMWEDMGIVNVQDAALHFLFSLAASSDGRASSDLLSNQESICDSLLFSMQSHLTIPSVQLKGCSILACLASASSNNKRISDGSLSGAQLMVLSALSNHVDSIDIQKAGIQALYFQCSLSEHAESNKRNLMDTTLEDGLSGIEVVVDTMTRLRDDVVAMEWACSLMWCLTSSEDLVNATSKVPEALEQVVKACQRHLANPDAVALIEASFGVFGNLAYLENARAHLHQIGVVQTLIDGMHFHRKEYGVNIEACAAIANLSILSSVRDSVVRGGGVAAVIDAMQVFMESPECLAEAARALVCLSIEYPAGKEQMRFPEIFHIIAEAGFKHSDSPYLQEMSSALVSSLSADPISTDLILESGGVDVLIQVLNKSSEERVLNATTLAFRNISCQTSQGDCFEVLRQPATVGGTIRAMQAFEGSASIQTNGCCFLWNVASQTVNSPGSIVGFEGVQSLVKAMQWNMESGELLELACGTLWEIVDNPLDRKRGFVGSETIDAVTCAMVMHPGRTSTLEKACGVLSSASLDHTLAEAMGNAQAVSIIAEAMRSNSSSLPLLEFGCITVRNIVSLLPEFAQEGSAVVSIVLNAIKENMDALGFIKEACNLLWVLAVKAESCQSKISALDGVAVLMQCVEQITDPAVHSAAMGAFNQISKEQS
eukprot:scaffold10090_cov119-Cylindrotheca_fusiformis.AAC.3